MGSRAQVINTRFLRGEQMSTNNETNTQDSRDEITIVF